MAKWWAAMAVLALATPVSSQERRYEDVAVVMREHGLVLAAAQRFHHQEKGKYAAELEPLVALLREHGEVLAPLAGYHFEIVAAEAGGWVGRVRNSSFGEWECVVAVGSVSAEVRTSRGTPAGAAGRWTCDPGPTEAELAVRALRGDLRWFATHQERYYVQRRSYARTVAELSDFQVSPGVQFTIERVDATGWAARAAHPAWVQGDCVMFYGGVPSLRTRGGLEGQVGRAICDSPAPGR
jgi:hypothetical protein